MFLLRHQQFKGDERRQSEKVGCLSSCAPGSRFPSSGAFLGTGVVFLSVILSLTSRIGIYIPPPHTVVTYCTHSAVLYLTTQSIFALLFGSYVSFLQVHGFCSVITLVTMIFCNTLNLPFLLSAFRDFPMLNSYYFYFHFPFSLPPFLSRLMIILFLLGQPFILFNYFYLLFKLVSSNAISWTLSIFYGPNNTIFN